MSEQRASMGEHRGSKWTKRTLAREQSGGILRLKLEDTIYIYIYVGNRNSVSLQMWSAQLEIPCQFSSAKAFGEHDEASLQDI